MLDLSFVRDNLPLVEEKLRQRGMDPGEVLKDFRAIDTERRQAITETETMKARRNRASEEIAPLKKSGQDASALIAETLKIQSAELRDKRMQAVEEKAAKLATKMIFPTMICFMPVCILILVTPAFIETFNLFPGH